MKGFNLSDISSIILPAGILLIAYSAVQKVLTPDKPTSTAVSAECPRGPRYTRGLFMDCDPNYEIQSLTGDWLYGGSCVCLSQPKAAPDPTPAPVTTPPWGFNFGILPFKFPWSDQTTENTGFEPTPWKPETPFVFIPPPPGPINPGR